MEPTRVFLALAGLFMMITTTSCGPGQGPAREESVRESLRQQDEQEANERLRRLKMHVAESMPKPDSLATDSTALTPVPTPAPVSAPARTNIPAPAPARTPAPVQAPARTTVPAPAPVSPPDSTETN